MSSVLFPVGGGCRPGAETLPVLRVDGGVVQFTLEDLDGPLLPARASSGIEAHRGASVLRWSRRRLEAELLMAPSVAPRIPSGMRLSSVGTGVWRLRLRDSMPRLGFVARWLAEGVPLGECANCGSDEFCMYVVWRRPPWVIGLSVEDGELLRQRALDGTWFPHRMAPSLGDNAKPPWASGVDFLSDGLRASVGPVVSGDAVQLAFTVASAHWDCWSPRPGPTGEIPPDTPERRWLDLEEWVEHALDPWGASWQVDDFVGG